MKRVQTKTCQICSSNEWKYTCSTCRVVYCSVSCYKRHKAESCSSSNGNVIVNDDNDNTASGDSIAQASGGSSSLGPTNTSQTLGSPIQGRLDAQADGDADAVEDKKPLRPLTSLKWPYIPDQPSYPDPLKRDDPKPLNLRQYENIASSPALRKILTATPSLKTLLTGLDKLRGDDREEALQRMLQRTTQAHLDPVASKNSAGAPGRYGSGYGGYGERVFEGEENVDEEQVEAFRELVKAVEEAVRGDGDDVQKVGVDWEVVGGEQ